MRDRYKDEQYFSRFISESENGLNNLSVKLKNGEVLPERVNFVKIGMLQYLNNIISAKYSKGESIEEIKSYLLDAIQLTFESWDGFGLLYHKGKTRLNQYGLSTYDSMLWMLSLGYLLNIDDVDFKKLVAVIDRDQVKDFLYEFIIRTKLKDRQPITEESYEIYYYAPKAYELLRTAIIQYNMADAEKLVAKFVRKDWYNKHKSAGWYNSHLSNGGYFGYWSFETAAVLKIMGLDDSSFRDCPYYPKDLISFSRSA